MCVFSALYCCVGEAQGGGGGGGVTGIAVRLHEEKVEVMTLRGCF